MYHSQRRQKVTRKTGGSTPESAVGPGQGEVDHPGLEGEVEAAAAVAVTGKFYMRNMNEGDVVTCIRNSFYVV